jgi:chromosome segregation ATPase
VLEILPELKLLEPDTLEMLFAQAEQHAKYEAAARDLVNAEVAKYEDAHERELRALRLESESQHTRSSVSAEMRMQAQEEAAREETDRLREEAMEKISELEEEVAKLEEKVEEQKAEMEQLKQQHEEEINEMNEEREKLVEIVDEAQKETELKRETSRKLKEEIIDNDRLTVANLNRIKNLEIEIEETRKLCEKLDDENEELREELGKSLKDEGASAALEREVEMLRELLSEREQQVRSLSLRLADASSSSGAGSGGFGSSSGFNSSSSGRRESILDRLGLNKGPTAI